MNHLDLNKVFYHDSAFRAPFVPIGSAPLLYYFATADIAHTRCLYGGWPFVHTAGILPNNNLTITRPWLVFRPPLCDKIRVFAALAGNGTIYVSPGIAYVHDVTSDTDPEYAQVFEIGTVDVSDSSVPGYESFAAHTTADLLCYGLSAVAFRSTPTL